jgi:hypothetical protein
VVCGLDRREIALTEPPAPIGWEDERPPEGVWTLPRIENTLTPVEDPASSLVTMTLPSVTLSALSDVEMTTE